MSDVGSMNDFNQRIIAEFRANKGVVGGMFAGMPMLILHSKGAKSGVIRQHPLAYQPRGDNAWAIFASKAGAPTNPDWYHNLVAHPDASIEVGADTVPVTTRVLEGAERSEVWEAQKAASAAFAKYEAATTRVIPVVLLSRA